MMQCLSTLSAASQALCQVRMCILSRSLSRSLARSLSLSLSPHTHTHTQRIEALMSASADQLGAYAGSHAAVRELERALLSPSEQSLAVRQAVELVREAAEGRAAAAADGAWGAGGGGGTLSSTLRGPELVAACVPAFASLASRLVLLWQELNGAMPSIAHSAKPYLEHVTAQLVKDRFSRATVSEVLESAMHMDSAKSLRAHELLVARLRGSGSFRSGRLAAFEDLVCIHAHERARTHTHT
jgi:hypothetical protein